MHSLAVALMFGLVGIGSQRGSMFKLLSVADWIAAAAVSRSSPGIGSLDAASSPLKIHNPRCCQEPLLEVRAPDWAILPRIRRDYEGLTHELSCS